MIAVADIHLRHDKPTARKDDYWQAQEKKFFTLLELARQNSPLVVAGDFFHKARPPIPLIRWVIDALIHYDVVPIVIPGQHDMPYHSLNRLDDSGLGILQAAGLVNILIHPSEPYFYEQYALFGCPFGKNPSSEIEGDISNFTKVLIWHHLVIRKGEELWPGQKATIAGQVLRRLRQYDLVITGDNHQTFIETTRKRRHINPGSMMRMSIDQVDHKPCVYDVEQNKFIYLPIDDDVFDMTQSVSKAEREARIASFIEHLQTGYEVGVSFERNLEIFLAHNSVSDSVQTLVRRCLGDTLESLSHKTTQPKRTA